MKLPQKSHLTDRKYNRILRLIDKLGINLEDIEEKYVKGSGRGGQKLNKASNAVQLKHLPTGKMVKCQRERLQSMNRILALRELLDKLNPESESEKKSEKIRKQKNRRYKRAVKKL
jgi:protein subunit release factor B